MFHRLTSREPWRNGGKVKGCAASDVHLGQIWKFDCILCVHPKQDTIQNLYAILTFTMSGFNKEEFNH